MVVLVAPSGKGHKGTAIRLGRKLMSLVGVKVIKGKGSTEKIINNIAGTVSIQQAAAGAISTTQQDAVATIIAPELSVLLSKATYSDSLVDFLTDIYDAEDPFTYMTQGGGNIILKNPCVTFLAGATPTSIGDSIPQKAHESGYLGRVLHVYHNGDEKEGDALVDIDDSDLDISEVGHIQQLELDLVDGLKAIKQLNGAFNYTKEAREWLAHWYQQWLRHPKWQSEGYPTRRTDHMLRIAMLLRISQHLDLTLDLNTLKAADMALGRIEEGFQFAFANIGESPIAKSTQRVILLLKAHGGRCTSAELARGLYRYFRDYDEIKQVLKTLREAGLIVYEGITNHIEYWRLP